MQQEILLKKYEKVITKGKHKEKQKWPVNIWEDVKTHDIKEMQNKMNCYHTDRHFTGCNWIVLRQQ